MKTKRIGILRISTKLLGDLLQLPENHKIINVLGSDQRSWLPYEFEIIIEGPKMPECLEGYQIPVVDGILEKGKEMRFE